MLHRRHQRHRIRRVAVTASVITLTSTLLSAFVAPSRRALVQIPLVTYLLVGHQDIVGAEVQPSEEQVQLVANAYAALAQDPDEPGGLERVQKAEADFGEAIKLWEGPLARSKEETARLRLARARSRILQNDIARGTRPDKAREAVADYDVALRLMNDDFEANPGKAMYSEYPSALVSRGLAKEEVKDWKGAVEDYSQAINIWQERQISGKVRSKEDLGINPLVLNFRGNALVQLGKYDDAVADYSEASEIFSADGELRQASLSRANQALAVFGAGDREEATRLMTMVLRKDPGVTDLHVALATIYWDAGQVEKAESEWLFACEKINTGCQQYKDIDWVTNIRRWPPALVSLLQAFLGKISPAQV